MNKCQKIQDSLADYRTGLLSSRQVADLEQHISGCAECAKELEALDSVLSLVEENLLECEPPAGLWNGVYNRINDPQPTEAGFSLSFLGWFAKPMHAAATGIAALALAAAIYVGTPDAKPVQHVQMSAADEFTQGHALYASQSSLADRATYLTLVNASTDTSVTR